MHIRRLIPEPIRTLLRPIRRAFMPDPPVFIGYLRSRGPQGISGWIHDPTAPARRLPFEAVIERAGKVEVVAEGVADLHDAELAALAVGDACYGFRIALPAGVAPADAARVQIRPKGSLQTLELGLSAPIGYVRSRAGDAIEGWAHDRTNPDHRVAVDAVLERGGATELLATATADRPDRELMALGFGDGRYGFRLVLPPGLAPGDAARVRVRPAGWDIALGDANQGIVGAVREQGPRHIAGWMRNAADPARKLAFEVRTAAAGRTRILARGVADQRDPRLSVTAAATTGPASADCGFRVELSADLTAEERANLTVHCVETGVALPRARGVSGFVRAISTTQVAGWVRHEEDPARPVEVVVRCTLPGAARELGRVVANAVDPVLVAAGEASVRCGFRLAFDPPLTPAERDSLVVACADSGVELPHAQGALLGYVRECTTHHVSGWLRREGDPERRVAFVVRCTLPGAERVLARGVADRPDAVLAATGVADADCGFEVTFVPPLSAAERDHVVVQCADTAERVARAKGALLGYVDACTRDHVAGWVRRADDPARRVRYVVRCSLPGAERVLAEGVADQPDPVLAACGVRDAACGFRVAFDPPLSEAERDHVVVQCADTAEHLPRAVGALLDDAAESAAQRDAAVALAHAQASVVGYVRERSTRHVAGWAHNSANPAERLEFDVVLADGAGERVIAAGVADQFDRVLFALGLADPVHGFRVLYDAPIDEADCDRVEVRVRATGQALPLDPNLVTEWKPVRFIAMDIVDNCNLRCPFCLFDHAPVHKTNVMDEDIFERALRWLPYVGPEGLWMSCLHEPSMHPKLPDMIERIPREHRHRMHYTTNLSRRMPDRYYQVLADSGLSNINVSIESRDPAIYERMRKGAKHRIFMENWEKLLAAFAKGSAPPPLRYIAMAYKSNYRELPSLIEWLRTERRAWKVEIRDTMDVPWIPQEFRETEFLERPQWVWLRDQLAHYPPTEVTLCLPPDFDVPQPDEGPQPSAQAVAAPTRDTPPVAMAPQDAELPAPSAPDSGSSEPASELIASDAKLQELRDDPLFAQKSARLPGLLEGRILHDGLLIVSASVAGNYPYHGEVVAQLNIREVDDPDAFIMSLLRAEGRPGAEGQTARP